MAEFSANNPAAANTDPPLPQASTSPLIGGAQNEDDGEEFKSPEGSA